MTTSIPPPTKHQIANVITPLSIERMTIYPALRAGKYRHLIDAWLAVAGVRHGDCNHGEHI